MWCENLCRCRKPSVKLYSAVVVPTTTLLLRTDWRVLTPATRLALQLPYFQIPTHRFGFPKFGATGHVHKVHMLNKYVYLNDSTSSNKAHKVFTLSQFSPSPDKIYAKLQMITTENCFSGQETFWNIHHSFTSSQGFKLWWRQHFVIYKDKISKT